MLGLAIFAGAVFILYQTYSGQIKQQDELNTSLAAAQGSLPKLLSDRTSLENQLAQWTANLTEAKSALNQAQARFPGLVESIEYDEQLFQIADMFDLVITSLSATEPVNQKIQNVTFSMTNFSLSISGEVTDILGFINTLTTDEAFATATIETVDMSVPVPVSTTENLTGQTETVAPTADIAFIIYSYKVK